MSKVDTDLMRPIFQIAFWGDGWIFPEEVPENEQVSTGFAIAWRPHILLQPALYFMPGEINGVPTLLRFVTKNQQLVFEHPDIAFALVPDPKISEASPWGLPYAGQRFSILSGYGKGDFPGFMPLIPDDLDAIDRLYLEQRIIFVGVTAHDLLKIR